MSIDGEAPPLGEALVEALLATLAVARSAIAEGDADYAKEALGQARGIAARLSPVVREGRPRARPDQDPPPRSASRDERVEARASRLGRVPLKRRRKDVLALLRKADGPRTAKQVADELGLTITVARRVLISLRDDSPGLLTVTSGVRGQPASYSVAGPSG